MFIQIYFRTHHFVVKFSKFSSPAAARGHWPPNQNPADADVCTPNDRGVWRYMCQCVGVRHTAGGACEVTGRTQNWKWFILTLLRLNYSSEQHRGNVTMQVSSFYQDIFERCRHYEIHVSFCLAPHTLVHTSSHSRLNGTTCNVALSFQYCAQPCSVPVA